MASLSIHSLLLQVSLRRSISVFLTAESVRESLQYRWQVLWRAACVRGLLEGVGQFDERGFAESAAHEGDANGQAEGVAGGYGDGRVAGQRGRLRAAANGMVAVHQVDAPGGRTGGHDERVELVLIHDGVDPFLAGKAMVLFKSGQILRIIERGSLFCL